MVWYIMSTIVLVHDHAQTMHPCMMVDDAAGHSRTVGFLDPLTAGCCCCIFVAGLHTSGWDSEAHQKGIVCAIFRSISAGSATSWE